MTTFPLLALLVATTGSDMQFDLACQLTQHLADGTSQPFQKWYHVDLGTMKICNNECAKVTSITADPETITLADDKAESDIAGQHVVLREFSQVNRRTGQFTSSSYLRVAAQAEEKMATKNGVCEKATFTQFPPTKF